MSAIEFYFDSMQPQALFCVLMFYPPARSLTYRWALSWHHSRESQYHRKDLAAKSARRTTSIRPAVVGRHRRSVHRLLQTLQHNISGRIRKQLLDRKTAYSRGSLVLLRVDRVLQCKTIVFVKWTSHMPFRPGIRSATFTHVTGRWMSHQVFQRITIAFLCR